MSEMRGIVTEITFNVLYPDGTIKISKITPKERLKAVLMTDAYMDDEMKKLFDKSRSDWKQNPAMIIVDGDLLRPNCDYPDCQNA